MDQSSQNGTQHLTPWQALGIVGEMGFLIALPAFLFGFGGAYADKAFGTGPWGAIFGLLVAFCLSSLAVWRMIKRLLPEDRPGS